MYIYLSPALAPFSPAPPLHVPADVLEIKEDQALWSPPRNYLKPGSVPPSLCLFLSSSLPLHGLDLDSRCFSSHPNMLANLLLRFSSWRVYARAAAGRLPQRTSRPPAASPQSASLSSSVSLLAFLTLDHPSGRIDLSYSIYCKCDSTACRLGWRPCRQTWRILR